MNLKRLEYIACPSNTEEDFCGGKLALSEKLLPPIFHYEFPDELLEGVLECLHCGNSYPVLSGVAILLPNCRDYLRHNFTFLVAVCHQLGQISNRMLHYLQSLGAGLLEDEGLRWYNSQRKISKYFTAHYDNLSDVITAASAPSINQRWLEENPYDVTFSMAKAFIPADALTLDIGGNVGGATSRFAGASRLAFSVDLSFRAVLIARRILLHIPTPLKTYPLFEEGDIFHERTLPIERRENVEIVLGTALSLPFGTSMFDAVGHWNLLDIIPDPRRAITEQLRVLKSGGVAMMSDPYCWEIEITDLTRQIGGYDGQYSADALKRFLDGKLEVLAERDYVPWLMRIHNRRFDLYFNHCLVGRKLTAKPPS